MRLYSNSVWRAKQFLWYCAAGRPVTIGHDGEMRCHAIGCKSENGWPDDITIEALGYPPAECRLGDAIRIDGVEVGRLAKIGLESGNGSTKIHIDCIVTQDAISAMADQATILDAFGELDKS